MSPLFSQILEQSFSTVAGLLLVIATTAYIISVIKSPTNKPRILSWIGWSLLMGITVFSQIFDAGWQWSQVGLFVSIIGCLIIAIIAIKKNQYEIKKPHDPVCVLLGVICIIIYVSTKNALLTTSMAIVADFIVAIPTIHNAWKDPASEKTSGWTFGIVSWGLTLLICIGHSWIYALFPIYLFLLNGTMIMLTKRKLRA